MNNHKFSGILALLLFVGILLPSSCAIKNDDLIRAIGQKKNIVLYTVCQKKNGFSITDHYLFKIKEDRITLTEKHGDRVSNKFTKDLKTAKILEQLIIDSSDEGPKTGSCEYYIKCGIQECTIYPDDNEIAQLEKLLELFSVSV